MDYNWQVVMDSFKPLISGGFKAAAATPTTPTAVNEELPISPASSPDLYVPFLIEPVFGSIPPKGTGQFTVKFSPLNTIENSGHLICR